MTSRWNKKKYIFLQNNMRKKMRLLQRKNKRYRHIVGHVNKLTSTSNLFLFLKNTNFAENPSKFTSILKRVALIEIPPSFSISENPNESIQILRRLFYFGSQLNIHEIEIDYSQCINLEIAASTIMDVIVLVIKDYHTKNHSHITFCGSIPKKGRVKDIFMASGLYKHLKIDIAEDVAVDYSQIKSFDLIHGGHNSKRSDSAATRLAEYINHCLNTQGYALAPPGTNLLSVMFGEVLDNCELHGGPFTEWFALGHFQTNPNLHNCGEIQLVIANFGNTIYQQLSNPNVTSKETFDKLEFLSKKHKPYFSSTWNEEMLYTLFSLQEGISRLRNQDVDGNRKRGTGTIKLIERFQQIGQTTNSLNPLMTITSGHTHIRFDQKYLLGKNRFHDTMLGNNERKIIAFNDTNDIYLPPDSSNVQKLDEFFQGTIISLNFFFDQQYLEKFTPQRRQENE